MEYRSIAPIRGAETNHEAFTDLCRRSLHPNTFFFSFFIPCTRSHGNTLCSNHGDADENGEDDDVDCHGNTGWVVGRVWAERDRGVGLLKCRTVISFLS